MSGVAHTAGPWRIRENAGHDAEQCNLSICGDIFVLADINGPQYAHQEANAHLIAAAPDLLAAAIQYRDDLRYPPTGDSLQRRLEMVEAAISKASPTLEGKS